MDMRTLDDFFGKTSETAIIKAIAASVLLDPSEKIRASGMPFLKNHVPYLVGGFVTDNQVFLAIGAKDKNVPIYVSDVPELYAGEKVEQHPFWGNTTSQELELSPDAVTHEEILRELFPFMGRGGYKILIHPIEDFKVRSYSPNGIIELGDSEVKNGFRIGVKECSPKREFEKEEDIPAVNMTDLVFTLRSYKAIYLVEQEEIYWGGKGEPPLKLDELFLD